MTAYFLPPCGYVQPPPHYSPGQYNFPQVAHQPWSSINYPQPSGSPYQFPSWQPPTWSRPWRGGRGRGQWSQKSSVVFECKPCKKQYKSEEAYNTHLHSHVQCSSCEFVGSGKALKDHELLHNLPDELRFSSDEDIQKWREARKRNYPTAENVARKQQLATKKSERGELAVTPLHRYIQSLIGDDSSRGPRGGGRRSRGRGQRRSFSRRGQSYKQSSGSKHTSKSHEDIGKADPGAQESIVGAILADCSAQTEVGGCEERPPSTKKHCGEEYNRGRRQQKRAKVGSMGLCAVPNGGKPTLLEKLLAREIRREENALLQCIRHISTNAFFQPQRDTTSPVACEIAEQ